MATAPAADAANTIPYANGTAQTLAEADIITRLQTSLDQLATQFYAATRYLSTHHPLIDFDGTPLDSTTILPLRDSINAAGAQAQTPNQQPQTPGGPGQIDNEASIQQDKKSRKEKKDKSSSAAKTGNNGANDAEPNETATKQPLSPSWTPVEPDAFGLDIAELAGDLIAKQKQIEKLLEGLPTDLVAEEKVQEQRIAELIEELDGLEGGIQAARRERDELLGRVESVIERVGRRGGG